MEKGTLVIQGFLGSLLDFNDSINTATAFLAHSRLKAAPMSPLECACLARAGKDRLRGAPRGPASTLKALSQKPKAFRVYRV